MEDNIKDNAINIAQSIIAGNIDPNLGCDKLAQLCEENNHPSELAMFSLLSHDQRGHEHLGFDLENTATEIIEESRKFVSKNT
ncbi:hypothetical protein [Shewanella gelidii]|uniref:Uncharacterized protein n=1 Tax=Shewanella gelidii TaxID=1642821 RepID=A0A917JXP7_9GAMM|nr:hypothetical protein [Shewanella gelidii]MCL1098552.1 hypothetical protein [Shewanella gelidii]GGI87239.1 hypothetical protein GCM10009332_25600 [Shewanella gelidii]